MSADGATRTSPAPAGPVPDGGQHGPDRAGERIAERLLVTVREDLGRADSKAAVLLSGALALPAFLIGRHGSPDGRGPPAAGEASGGGGVGGAGCARGGGGRARWAAL
ncbi:hypothetical protein ACFWJY_10160, partial [Streptomyces anulatus]